MRVDRQLRVGADRRREQRAVEHVQVARDGDGGRCGSTTACARIGAQRRSRPSRAPTRPASRAGAGRTRRSPPCAAAALAYGAPSPCTGITLRAPGGELDLRHRGERAAHAVPQVRRQRIVEHRRAVVAQAHRAAGAVADETRRAAARCTTCRCGSSRIQLRVRRAVAGQRDRRQQRMDRRRLELEARSDRRSAACRGSDRSRSSAARRRSRRSRSGMSAADTTVGCRNVRLPTHAVRIGHAAAQQQRRRADRAGRGDERARAHDDARATSARVPRGVHRRAFERRRRGRRAMTKRMRARARDQRRAAIERARDRRDQHRLLGVGRAAHAAVAEVPAALDVAPDRRRGDAELRGAARERRVVRVGRDVPRRDRRAALPCARTTAPDPSAPKPAQADARAASARASPAACGTSSSS